MGRSLNGDPQGVVGGIFDVLGPRVGWDFSWAAGKGKDPPGIQTIFGFLLSWPGAERCTRALPRGLCFLQEFCLSPGVLLGFSWASRAGWGEVFLGNYLGAFLTLGWFLGEPFGNVPCVGEVLPLLQVLTPLFYTDFPASPFPLTFGIFLHAGTLH